MTLTKKEASKLLGISPRTLERRMASGQYKFTRTGVGQFAELSFTYSDIGLPEPVVEPVPAVAAEPQPEPAPLPKASECDKRIAADLEFAAKYRAGEVTDSMGNNVHGTNEKFPTKGMQPLIGMPRPEPAVPRTGTSHMQPELLSDYVGPMDKPFVNPQVSSTGTTRNGSPLTAGYSQEKYDADMQAWRRSGGGRSMGEQEMATRRSVQTIHSAFPKADRT